jgi:hypothetical protein
MVLKPEKTMEHNTARQKQQQQVRIFHATANFALVEVLKPPSKIVAAPGNEPVNTMSPNEVLAMCEAIFSLGFTVHQLVPTAGPNGGPMFLCVITPKGRELLSNAANQQAKTEKAH